MVIEEVAERLHSCAVRLLRRARVADREATVGPAQLSVLSVLYFSGALPINRLAELEQVAQPTMSRLVTSLMAAGAVTRRASADDRRVQLVEITPAGRAIFELARARRLEIIRAVVAKLDPAALHALMPALDQLAEAIAQS
ncbi:MAG: MarR family transcriptional regulator [Rhodospirillales bacterium]